MNARLADILGVALVAARRQMRLFMAGGHHLGTRRTPVPYSPVHDMVERALKLPYRGGCTHSSTVVTEPVLLTVVVARLLTRA